MMIDRQTDRHDIQKTIKLDTCGGSLSLLAIRLSGERGRQDDKKVCTWSMNTKRDSPLRDRFL